jgi:hypothetical protein
MDFATQLLGLADDLKKLAPKLQDNPESWMRRAMDFRDAALEGERLHPHLLEILPMKERGDFTRHVVTIGKAGKAYNSDQMAGINSSLAYIIETLNQKLHPHLDDHFSVATIPDIANRLTVVQKQVLDQIWNYYVAFDKSLPLRILPSIIGKQSVQEAFKGLNGSIVYEKSEQDGRSFELTVYGAFLTGHGSFLASLLIRLLELIRHLYEEDSFIKVIDNNQIRTQLDASDSDTNLLFKLINLNMPPNMPFYVSSLSGDGSSWTLCITDEVMELFRAKDSAQYLNERLSAGYRPDEPFLYDDRTRRNPISAPTPFSLFNTFPTSINQYSGQVASPFVSVERMNALKELNNTDFDCTRLICLCDELNECASRENAHAVIMLTRSILDHVPPVFGHENFRRVASNYGGGGVSFKKSVERLENQSRRVADRLLHMPIRNREAAPTMHEVNFAPEVETLLAEFCRLLK